MYYDPANPSNAVLEPSITGFDISMWLLVSGLPFYAGVVLLWIVIRKYRRARSELEENIRRYFLEAPAA